jgi:ABC-2 type transport system permease protein
MPKLWLVAGHEFRNMTQRRSFLMSTIGLPLLIGGIMAISILASIGEGQAKPLGYVDHAGILPGGAGAMGQEHDVTLQAFADEATAGAALAAGMIQSYYVLPADYRRTGQAQLYYAEDASNGTAQRAFSAFLRDRLLAGQPEAVRQRVADGIHLTVRSSDGRREFSELGILNVILPFVAGMAFGFGTLMAAGYLLQAVTTEKENRTVEVMATSLSPLQLVGGKAVGLIGVALTQLGIWAGAIVVGLIIAAQFWPEARAVRLPWGLLGVTALYFLPAYVLVAGIMVAIGGMVAEMRQAQQISGIVNLLFMLPFFVSALIFSQPDSPLLVALTLFPTTSFITILMRWGVTVVPAWQLVTSWLMLAASAVLSVWAAARIFRAGMLHYGQPLNLRTAWAALRG